VLRHGDARHVVPRREGHERLTVAGEQLIKQRPPGRVGQCPEHEIHVIHNRKPFGFLSTQESRPAGVAESPYLDGPADALASFRNLPAP
jgi:hypothetical protein